MSDDKFIGMMLAMVLTILILTVTYWLDQSEKHDTFNRTKCLEAWYTYEYDSWRFNCIIK